jgi:hypothetical protein
MFMKTQGEFQKHVAQRSFFSVAAALAMSNGRKATERAIRYQKRARIKRF